MSAVEPPFLGVLSRAATRAVGSRFAKPIARAALAGAGLAILAFIGRTAVAGAVADPVAANTASVGMAAEPPSTVPRPGGGALEAPAARALLPAATDNASAVPISSASTASTAPTAPAAPSRASPDDPVFLNTASDIELRRLPGVGAKRADAILGLRARLGRFRALEDLLKVKGIGRATLKRLRPLVRLDPPASDGGPPRPPTSNSP
jgi:competence protein ComEA